MTVMPSPTPKVATAVTAATVAEIEPVISVLTAAFSADPAIRWVFPDAHQYRTHFPEFVRAFGGKALGFGTALCACAAPGSYTGVALWLPPNVHPDEEALAATLGRALTPEDQERVYAVFEQMDAWHPQEPHWYLPLLGVDPYHQRQGYGAALMAPILEACDRDGVPAYLESSNMANLSFYERHGFEVLTTIQSEGAPPVFPMLRTPRER